MRIRLARLAGSGLISSIFLATLAAQQTPPASADSDKLEPVQTSITVLEKVSTEAPSSVMVKDALELREVPGINLDDRLRMVPGFSLFRRAPSTASHPTTQGVSLRGIGSTGTSRTLVLWDNVPLNDPFGGWVFWSRVAPEELGRVEVSRGTSTAAFGDRALGGVITLFTREPEHKHLYLGYEYGAKNTNQLNLGYSHLWKNFAFDGGTRAFTTNGFYIVPTANRGPVDSESNTRFLAPYYRIDYLGTKNRFYVKVDILAEERKNGTQLLRNSTSFGNISGHYAREFGNNSISGLGYHTRGEFRSNFSTINATRTVETLNLNQSVPFDGTGGAAYFRHNDSRWRGLFGADVLKVEGYSIEQPLPTGVQRVAGATQLQHGTFFQTDFSAKAFKFFVGARHQFTGQDRQFFAPSGGVTWGHGPWRVRASAYRSFRAPTLNELYREFRQGNSITQANSLLKPERLSGVETGVDYYGENARFSATAFYSSLKDLVANVTLQTGATIIRQRRNVAAGVAKGFEADFRQRFHRNFTAEFSYLFSDSSYRPDASIETRLRTAQIPRHQGSAQLTWARNGTNITAGMRAVSYQFDDDINTQRFRLAGYPTTQFSIQQRIKSSLSASFSMENALDRLYYTAFTPVPNSGTPRLWRGGLRWDGRIF